MVNGKWVKFEQAMQQTKLAGLERVVMKSDTKFFKRDLGKEEDYRGLIEDLDTQGCYLVIKDAAELDHTTTAALPGVENKVISYPHPPLTLTDICFSISKRY